MRWSDIQFDPQRKTLRQFSLLWLAFFGGLACWQYFAEFHRTAAAVLAVLAATIGPLGLVRPQLIRPIYVAWTVLAFPIGWVVSWVILAVVFFGVFTPVALIFRLIGRDTLDRRRGDQVTYWQSKQTPTDPRRYLQQF